MFLSVPVKGVARQAAICCAAPAGSCCREAAPVAASSGLAASVRDGALRTGPYNCKAKNGSATEHLVRRDTWLSD